MTIGVDRSAKVEQAGYTSGLVRRDEPFLREAALASIPRNAPAGSHFVRTHGAVPSGSPSRQRPGPGLRIDGAVARPLDFTVHALRRRPQHEICAVLECAGNGRRHFVPPADGDQWGDGAVSCARWSGVPLAALLEEAGVSPDATALACHGESSLDSGGFVRGLPLDAALRRDVVVALVHEDEPLRPEHGAPLRLVVPGWYGVAWTKWLTRVEVLDRPFTGYWNTERYIVRRPGEPDRPLTTLPCKAVVTSPRELVTCRPCEPVDLRGFAWSGHATVNAVDVSDDGGATWWPTALEPGDGPWAWSSWSARWWPPAVPGRYELVVRATDATGHVQPPAEDVEWNVFGYGWDGRPVVVADVLEHQDQSGEAAS